MDSEPAPPMTPDASLPRDSTDEDRAAAIAANQFWPPWTRKRRRHARMAELERRIEAAAIGATRRLMDTGEPVSFKWGSNVFIECRFKP